MLRYLWIVKHLCGSAAAVAALAAALFAWYGTVHEKGLEKTRNRFAQMWAAVEGTRWNALPDRVAVWLLSRPIVLWAYLIGSRRAACLTYANAFVLYGAALIVLLGFWYGIAVSLLSVTGTFAVILAIGARGKRRSAKAAELNRLARGPQAAFVILAAVVSIAGTIKLLLGASLMGAVLIAAAAVPALMVSVPLGVMAAAGWYPPRDDAQAPSRSNNDFVGALAVPLSLFLTTVALGLGHVLEPRAAIPKTLQLLSSSVICDVITMIVTYRIFQVAVRRQELWRIPVALAADLVIAAILAVACAYFGVLHTNIMLAPHDVLHVFVGLSPNGRSIELGPLFWVTHTTFIPTVFYALAVAVAWLAKTILGAASWFFGIGQASTNPLNLTGALLGVIAAVLAAVAYAASILEEVAAH